ncbi:MAG: acyl-CoA thioesterase [Candidatus Marinimicrobia bacterium]|nr:acyl-CoA thioesterase [Candidatus Neomarinimicrobiota bacterium]MBT3618553.1 acyl-CoA thioesterase [Candidatus Neomarinimicrobiota bacterium]MBT3828780.1 acyl-CoA thioesterase [Candidatus Neomarinimicrobiota bacterium]MBT3996858.1 acyl-CoA thioesterase [Candidatus Neomarinimicrobiota bacterium]MBT4280991.1 acyl-CoA thioesterase [Candidatus Neomarinimicrobiota bacterium]
MIQYDHSVRVYYRDVDKMNIVYYSRYFEMFEEARTELLRSIGLDVTALENSGTTLPVVEAHADYKKGAGFEDELIVRTMIPELPKGKLRIEYKVLKGEELLVSGFTQHAFTNSDGNPMRAPEMILEVLLSVAESFKHSQCS